MAILQKIWERMMKAVEVLIVLSLLVIWASLLYQVITRYVFNKPTIWSEEVAMSLMIWVTFLGVSYGVRHRYHIRMNSVVKNLPSKAQGAVAILLDVIIIAVVAYSLPYAWDYFVSRCGVTSATMGISYGYVYVCVPIGYALLILSLIDDIVRVARGDIPQ